MSWLRDIERKIEERLEGKVGGGNMHALEAARVIDHLLADNRFSPSGAFTLVPSLILVPARSEATLPPEFEAEVERLVASAMKERGYQPLVPFKVRILPYESGRRDILACWVDGGNRPINGIIEAVEGPAKGSLWGIGEDGCVLGRGDDVQVRLIDPGVSRRHLKLQVLRGELCVEDLGSHNGTHLGKRQLTQPVLVKSGSKLSLGASVIRVWLLPAVSSGRR